MRALIVIVALSADIRLVGWISFHPGPDRASIDLETGKIRQDTQQAMQKGGELLQKAGDKIETDAKQQPESTRNPETVPVTR